MDINTVSTDTVSMSTNNTDLENMFTNGLTFNIDDNMGSFNFNQETTMSDNLFTADEVTPLVVEEDVGTAFDVLKNKITKEQLFKALENGVFKISKEDTIKEFLLLRNAYKNDVDLVLAKLKQLKEAVSLLEDLLSPYLSNSDDDFTNKLINYDNYLVQLTDGLLDVMRSSENLKSSAGILRNQLLSTYQYVKAQTGKYYSEKKLVDLLRDAIECEAMND